MKKLNLIWIIGLIFVVSIMSVSAFINVGPTYVENFVELSSGWTCVPAINAGYMIIKTVTYDNMSIVGLTKSDDSNAIGCELTSSDHTERYANGTFVGQFCEFNDSFQLINNTDYVLVHNLTLGSGSVNYCKYGGDVSGSTGNITWVNSGYQAGGSWVDQTYDMEIWQINYTYIKSGITPPTNSTWNVTSQNLPHGENSSIWDTGGLINITNNTLSLTVTTNEASNGSCAIGKDLNYTAMIADNINYKFATTETAIHSYLVYDNISMGNQCLYCSFINVFGNEFANSSSGCLNFTRTKPITGYVFDSLSNIIVGARVYITNLFTNLTESVITNSDGIYESNNYYQTGIHLISGYEPSNFTEQPDAQLVNVTE